jgi:hypothetical protein
MTTWKPLLSVLFLVGSAAPTAAQDPRPLYDARLSPSVVKLSAAEDALLDREVRPAARQVWKGTEGCADEFSVMDAAAGSFTRPKAQQKAFLYRFCTTGHGFGGSGLAVVEDGKIVAHLAYDGASDFALGGVRDLDGDGRSEILLAGGGTYQGSTVTSVTILGFIGSPASGVKNFGRFDVYEDDCGGENDLHTVTATRISAQPGAHPVFFRETFTKDGCHGSRWQIKGARETVSPAKDETVYRPISKR